MLRLRIAAVAFATFINSCLLAQTNNPAPPAAYSDPLSITFGPKDNGKKPLQTITVDQDGFVRFDPMPQYGFNDTCDGTAWVDEELHPKVPKKFDKELKTKQHCEEDDKYRSKPFVLLRYRLFQEYVRPEILVKKDNDLGLDLKKMRGSSPRQPLGRLLFVAVGEGSDSCIGNAELCYYASVLVNTAEKSGQSDKWIEGFTVTQEGLRINASLFDEDVQKRLGFAINGTRVTEKMKGLIFGSRDTEIYHVQVFEIADGCREYPKTTGAGTAESLDVAIPFLHLQERVDTGIRVSAPKVYDSYMLRSRLYAAGQQLAAISPWNAQAITNAYGTLQGVTRDTSYLAAQAQTAAMPSQVITNTTGSTSLSPSVVNSQTAQCPAGYFVSQISSSGVTCSQLPQQSQGCPPGYYVSQGPTANSSTTICSQLPNPNPTNQLPPVTLTSTQNNAPPQSTQVQTNISSLSPTIPTAPISTAFNAPTNVSVSSADMLAEQVQLNAQLQMYQMLLQGAQSDQFLLRNSRAIALRAQTTLGFQVSITPPRQFKHAVAEVRVVILNHEMRDRYSPPGDDNGSVSVVNLLPSQKTYNVARITSHQDAFGAGAIIEAVNVGASTGRSKDRLYLAKDTDTVALQYPNLTVPALEPPFPERTLEALEEMVKEQRLGECDSGPWEGEEAPLKNASVMFGWQFRPVLGADYVAPGPREVFAQLALPTGANDDGWAPAVYVQTRWREYDEKRQVVGPVYRNSCVWTRIQDAVAIVNPLKVRNVSWEDVGNGILKVRAEGEFFASGMTVMSGGTNISPTVFDGNSIQFFAPAHDLVQNGNIALLGESGKTTPLSISTNRSLDSGSCRISNASLKAVPYPDGNARAELIVEYAPGFKKDEGPPHLLVMIGNDVYGVQPKPFQDGDVCDPDQDHRSCTYHFLASTDSLRTGQTFLVRDIAWGPFSKTNPIDLGPVFTSLAPLSSTDVTSNVWYTVTGSGFSRFMNPQGDYTNLKVFLDDADGIVLTREAFKPLSDTTARIQLSHAPKSKSIKITWDPQADSYVQAALPVAWELAVAATGKDGISANPPYLYSGDSQVVTFTGAFTNVVDVEFEGTVLLKPDASNKYLNATTLDVPVTFVVTKTPGHKQLVARTVDDKGNPGKNILLSLDVFRR